MRRRAGAEWRDRRLQASHHHHTGNNHGINGSPPNSRHGSPDSRKTQQQHVRKSEENGISKFFRTLRNDERSEKKKLAAETEWDSDSHRSGTLNGRRERGGRRGSLDRSPSRGRESSPSRRRAKSMDRRTEKAHRERAYWDGGFGDENPLKDPPVNQRFFREEGQPAAQDDALEGLGGTRLPIPRGRATDRAFKNNSNALRDWLPKGRDRDEKSVRERSPKRHHVAENLLQNPGLSTSYSSEEVATPRLKEYYNTLRTESGQSCKQLPVPKRRPYKESHKDLSI